MASRRTHRTVNALALTAGAICLFLTIAVSVLWYAPSLAFAHSAGDGRITFHSTELLPEEATEAAAALGWAAMQDTPFGQPNHGIDVYITGGRGWRHLLFFRPAPWAGGLTYPMFSTRAIFLRDVDFQSGRLLGEDGPIPDPRDLTYYLVHEMTHLRHAEIVGPIEFLRTPRWVTEGVPDVAALGLADSALVAAAMAQEPLSRDTFGSYPLERTCVTMMLAIPTIGIEQVLDMRVPMHDERSCFTLPRPLSD